MKPRQSGLTKKKRGQAAERSMVHYIKCRRLFVSPISSSHLLVYQLNLHSQSPASRAPSLHSPPLLTSSSKMATSQKWLLLAVAMAVLFIGTAEAWKCKPGYKCCNPHTPGGCETCIWTDVNNCGDCHKKCKPLPYTTVQCHYGKCKYTCSHGWADCDNNIWKNGCETDVSKDARNCGKCGYCCKQVPNAITKCYDGKCKEPECKTGYANCDYNIWNGCEKDVSSDKYNCGSCKNVCKCTDPHGEAYCSHGKCYERCVVGWVYDKTKKCCVPYKKY